MLDWLRRPISSPASSQPAKLEIFEIETARGPLTIQLRRRSDARRMTLRMVPDGSAARITMPRWGRMAEAQRFAMEKCDWLAKQMVPVDSAPAPLGNGAVILFRGAEVTIDWETGNARKAMLANGTLSIGGPADAIPRRIRDWLKAEAKRLIAADLNDYCAKAGKPTPALALSSPTRRWGSCSSSGTIRINWRLIMAPDAVRRSVVAHEVAHLAHFDHSPAFHAELARLFEGDIKNANRWLKQYGRSLYQQFN